MRHDAPSHRKQADRDTACRIRNGEEARDEAKMIDSMVMVVRKCTPKDLVDTILRTQSFLSAAKLPTKS